MKSVHPMFPEPKETSSNILSDQQSKTQGCTVYSDIIQRKALIQNSTCRNYRDTNVTWSRLYIWLILNKREAGDIFWTDSSSASPAKKDHNVNDPFKQKTNNLILDLFWMAATKNPE